MRALKNVRHSRGRRRQPLQHRCPESLISRNALARHRSDPSWTSPRPRRRRQSWQRVLWRLRQRRSVAFHSLRRQLGGPFSEEGNAWSCDSAYAADSRSARVATERQSLATIVPERRVSVAGVSESYEMCGALRGSRLHLTDRARGVTAARDALRLRFFEEGWHTTDACSFGFEVTVQLMGCAP